MTTSSSTRLPTDTSRPAGGGPARPGASRAVAGAVAVLLVVVLALAVLPRPPRLSADTTGDPALGERARDLVDGATGRLGLAVAEVTPEGVRTAGLGHPGDTTSGPVTPDTPFEVGSVTKAMTGMLLADLAQDGVVDPEAPLDEVLEDTAFVDDGVGQATLAQLASHRSGLPRLPTGLRVLAWGAAGQLFGVDPYAWGDGSPGEVVDSAAAASTARPVGEFGYSNLGGALLGQALARATDTAYPQLLDERVLTPLGMDDTTVVTDRSALPAGRADPHRPTGRPVDPWVDAGYAPAGVGVWSTADDLGRLVAAVLDGSAPGADAARPRFDAGEGDRIGYGWLTTSHGDRRITWHNGGTGGFRAWVGMDREAGHGVVVLSNTAVATERVGLGLLGVEGPDPGMPWTSPRVWLPLGLLAIVAFEALRVLARRRPSDPPADRVDLAMGIGEPVALLLLAAVVGPWHQVAVLPWLAAAVLVAAAAWRTGRAWPDTAPRRSRRPWTWAWVGVSLAIDALVVVVHPLLPLVR